MSSSQLPLRFDVQVPPDGRVEVRLPLPAGSYVTVYVVEQSADDANDAIEAIEALHNAAENDLPYEEFRRDLGF